MFFTVPFTVFLFNGLIGACDVMVAMLVDRKKKKCSSSLHKNGS